MRHLFAVVAATSLAACTPGPGADRDGDLFADGLRGTPDPALSAPPLCVDGLNCLVIDVPYLPWRVAPDFDGGAWVAFFVDDAQFSAPEALTLGDLTEPMGGGSGMYGDTFVAHVDAEGTWDALMNAGDHQPGPMAVAEDGALATSHVQFTDDLIVWNADGSERWRHTWASGDGTYANPTWGPEGDLWLTVLGSEDFGSGPLVGDGALFVVRLDAGTGALVWSRSVGVGIPKALFVDPDGAVFVVVEGSYAMSAGRLLDADIPYPHSAVARVDGADDWVTAIAVQNPVLLSTLAARDPDGGIVLGYAWNGAQFGTNGGSIAFGPHGPFPMDTWEDGAVAKVTRDGDWAWGRATAKQAIAALVVGDDGLLYGLTEEFHFTQTSGAVVWRLCEWLPGGAVRACRPAARGTLLTRGPDGALWWTDYEGQDVVSGAILQPRVVRVAP